MHYQRKYNFQRPSHLEQHQYTCSDSLGIDIQKFDRVQNAKCRENTPKFNHKTSWAHVGKHIFDRIHFFSKKRFTFVLKFRTLLTLQKLKFYQN